MGYFANTGHSGVTERLTLWRKLWVWIGYVLALGVISAAFLASVCSLFSPWLHEHKAYFESVASRSLGVQITLGDVELVWNISEPVLYLSNVKMSDLKTHARIVAFDQIKVNLAVWHSLIYRQWRLDGLMLRGAQVRIPSLKWDLGQKNRLLSGDNTALLKVAITQPEVTLRDISLITTLPDGETRKLFLERFHLQNKGNQHHARMSLTLLQDAPTIARLIADWEDGSSPTSWVPRHAKIAVTLNKWSLPQFTTIDHQQRFRVLGGIGDMTLSAEWANGAWRRAQCQGELLNLILRSRDTGEERTFGHVSGLVKWRNNADKEEISGDNISLGLLGHDWPQTHFLLSRNHKDSKFHLDTGYLNLKDSFYYLSGLMRFSEEIKKWLPALSPEGVVDALHIASEMNHFETGSLSLQGHDIQVNVDTVFDAPLNLGVIKGDMHWGVHAVTHLPWFSVNKLLIHNQDGNASVQMNWMTVKDEAPLLRLNGDFSLRHGQNISHYLPLQMFNPALTQWLKKAFLQGTVRDGHIALSGSLTAFPYDHDDGVFVISGVVEEAGLHFATGWPDLQHINGRLLFSSRKMAADVKSAELQHIKLSSVSLVIPTMGKGETQLHVSANAKSDLADAVHFIRQSPLNHSVGRYLKGIEFSGPMQAKLEMRVPLTHPGSVALNGELIFPAGSELQLTHWNLYPKNMTGRLGFNENGIISGALNGQLFSEPVSLHFQTEKQGLKAVLKGKVSSEAVRNWLQIKASHGMFTGSALYTADLFFLHGRTQPAIIFRSNLSGIGIRLGSWYEKVPEEAVDFALNIQNSTAKKINFKYNQLTGSIGFPTNTWLGGLDIYMPHLMIDTIKGNVGETMSPIGLPSVHFRSDDIRYDKLPAVKVDLQIAPIKNGIQVTQMTLDSKLFAAKATGHWLDSGSDFSGTLETADTDQLLAGLGQGSAGFEAGVGRVDFELSWPGSPFACSLNTLSGGVALNIGKGLITHLDANTRQKMGLGRMLNLFSLQTLPRRLSLDFSDLFQKGYGFDSIRGDFDLDNGSAYTDNAQIKGVVAQVNVSGRFGLVLHDYDLHVDILPHVTSSLPVVTAIATANPLIGVAAWMLDKAMSPTVSQMTTYRYHITGTWTHPEWQPVGKAG